MNESRYRPRPHIVAVPIRDPRPHGPWPLLRLPDERRVASSAQQQRRVDGGAGVVGEIGGWWRAWRAWRGSRLPQAPLRPSRPAPRAAAPLHEQKRAGRQPTRTTSGSFERPWEARAAAAPPVSIQDPSHRSGPGRSWGGRGARARAECACTCRSCRISVTLATHVGARTTSSMGSSVVDLTWYDATVIWCGSVPIFERHGCIGCRAREQAVIARSADHPLDKHVGSGSPYQQPQPRRIRWPLSGVSGVSGGERVEGANLIG
jgi:hypothetical protein